MRMEPPPSVPDGERAQPRRHRRARAAAGPAGRALQIPRIARDPEDEVVRGADPAERRRVRLAELMAPAAFIRATMGASSVGTLSA